MIITAWANIFKLASKSISTHTIQRELKGSGLNSWIILFVGKHDD